MLTKTTRFMDYLENACTNSALLSLDRSFFNREIIIFKFDHNFLWIERERKRKKKKYLLEKLFCVRKKKKKNYYN